MQSQEATAGKNSISDDEKAITLFDDYVYVCENSLKFGHLSRMRKKGKQEPRFGEYKLPVSFKENNLKEILCDFEQYQLRTSNSFSVDHTQVIEVEASEIITSINLT